MCLIVSIVCCKYEVYSMCFFIISFLYVPLFLFQKLDMSYLIHIPYKLNERSLIIYNIDL